MNTKTASPKCLTDLSYQDMVLHLSAGQSVETEARRWFKEVMDTEAHVYCHLIFQESEADTDEEVLRSELRQVYECYTDSGSNDYLYIVD
jgi:hypothetical protein